MTDKTPRIVVCQIGAREHYATARTLYKAGLLAELITDFWVRPGVTAHLMLGRLGNRLRGRYHPELADACVKHFNSASIGRALIRVARRTGSQWDGIVEQNRWFQREAVRHLKQSQIFIAGESKPIVLAYSYAAYDIFALARAAGFRTILAQIDGGVAEELLIASLWAKQIKTVPDNAPDGYWKTWREECRLADRIFVNSEWSRHLLIQGGIEQSKLCVVPVVYEREKRIHSRKRSYPAAFSTLKPLRVLYVGTVSLRKGVLEILEAARALIHRPVQFTIVGADCEGWIKLNKNGENVSWRGSVPRNQVAYHLDEAHVFLFPTHSDGFGVVQIEALSSGLPVIASRNCAAIVENGKTGFILEAVSADEIVRAVGYCLENPAKLADMSASALAAADSFALQSASAFLRNLEEFASEGL